MDSENIDDEKSMQINKLIALGEMTAGIMHEINNPLAVIHMLAGQLGEMVHEKPLPDARIQMVTEKIEKTVLRIAKIVHGVKSFSRDSRYDPMTAISLRTIIEDALFMVSPKLRATGMSIASPEHDDLEIECRGAQITQVIVNCVHNALDAIATHELPFVRLEIVEEEAFVRLHIVDSGTGIDPVVAAKLFQPFFTTKARGVGTGLGLHLSKKILEAHKGYFYIETTAPHTTFVLRLPKWQ